MYCIDNNVMYIKIKSVLVGGMTNGWDGVEIKGDFSEREIFLI